MAPQRSAAQSLRVAANQDMLRKAFTSRLTKTLRKAFASRLIKRRYERPTLRWFAFLHGVVLDVTDGEGDVFGIKVGFPLAAAEAFGTASGFIRFGMDEDVLERVDAFLNQLFGCSALELDYYLFDVSLVLSEDQMNVIRHDSAGPNPDARAFNIVGEAGGYGKSLNPAEFNEWIFESLLGGQPENAIVFDVSC